jgi:hypothetical protein
VHSDNADERVPAAFDEGVARLSRLMAQASAVERGWRERVRAALLVLLGFFDEQPSWARFLLLELESPEDAQALAERRRRTLTQLARALDRETAGRLASGVQFAPSSRLTAEMVVGGLAAVVRARLLEDAAGSCAQLEPALMAFISGIYRGGGREVAGLEHMPVRPTYRTTRVLDAVAATPRSNNREIADAAGLRDEGQTSKLLSRLQRRGLVENLGLGAAYGEPNEWVLTNLGERMLETARGLSTTAVPKPRKRRLVRGAA